MSDELTCPICTMPEPLIAGEGYECNTCAHQWLPEPSEKADEVHDVHGHVLAPGDDVVVIKDLKLNGKAGGIKVGTKVKSIRLVPGDHPVQGKVNGRTVLITPDKVKKA